MKVTLFHPSAPSYWLCESCTKNPIPRSLLYVCVRGSACQSIVQMLEVSVTSRGIFFSSGRWEKEGSISAGKTETLSSLPGLQQVATE